MFRTISLLGTPARSLTKTLNLLPFSSSISNSIKLPTQPSSPSTSPTPSISPLTIFSYPFSSRHKKTVEDDDTFAYNRDPNGPPKLFVVQPRLRPDAHLQAKLSEALNLANSLEEPRDGFYMDEFCEKTLPSHVVVQNPVGRYGKTNAATYFGPGTVENIKCHLNAAESEGEFDAVFVNAILSGVQQRNLERAWDKPVLDRVGLIIEIFNAHAQTKEAKLQSELAALEHKKTRLVRVRGLDGRLTFGSAGEAEVVSARGRGGSGGRGFISGAGETELQLQKRRILERHGRLLSQIAEVRRTRAVQRASRRRHGGSRGQGLSTVAVVGYTNAGKSTLVNALSHSELYSDDRLFATVDPRLRSVDLPSGRKVLLSDTVGFISDLPVELVEAFHATLEEVVEADLLVHVLDSSAADLEEQRSSVLQVLRQIGVSDDKLQNMIEVWNKVDLQGRECGIDETLTECEDDEVNFEDGAVKCEDDEAQEAVGTQSDLSLEESIDEDGIMPELSTKEDVDDQNIDNLEEGKNVDVQPYDNSKSWKMEDDQQGESSMGCKTVDGNSHSQPQDIQRVKTSAVTGIGLQELLILIDDKLKRKNILERRDTEVFDRKWRPPRDGDTDIAVEQ